MVISQPRVPININLKRDVNTDWSIEFGLHRFTGNDRERSMPAKGQSPAYSNQSTADLYNHCKNDNSELKHMTKNVFNIFKTSLLLKQEVGAWAREIIGG